jgi:hypothetical protein
VKKEGMECVAAAAASAATASCSNCSNKSSCRRRKKADVTDQPTQRSAAAEKLLQQPPQASIRKIVRSCSSCFCTKPNHSLSNNQPIKTPTYQKEGEEDTKDGEEQEEEEEE